MGLATGNAEVFCQCVTVVGGDFTCAGEGCRKSFLRDLHHFDHFFVGRMADVFFDFSTFQHASQSAFVVGMQCFDTLGQIILCNEVIFIDFLE